MSINQRRRAALTSIRNHIRQQRRYNSFKDPVEAQHQGMMIRLRNFFDFLGEFSTDEEFTAWFEREYEHRPQQAMIWAGRKTDREPWPPAKTSTRRAFRLYFISYILDTNIDTTNELTVGELRGLVNALNPSINASGTYTDVVSTESYLLARAMLKGNGQLMAELATVPKL